MPATMTSRSKPSGLYNEPNAALLDSLTELLNGRQVQVTVHRSATIHVTALGDTIGDMRRHLDIAATVLRRNGYEFTRSPYNPHLLYMSIEQQATGPRLTPGTPVYHVLGDPEDPEDTGTIYSVTDGGYGVIWTGDITPKFAASEEVAILPEEL